MLKISFGLVKSREQMIEVMSLGFNKHGLKTGTPHC